MAGIVPWALAVSFLWGLQPIIHKVLLKHQRLSYTTVMTFTALIHAACVVAFAVWHSKEIRRDWPKLTVSNLAAIAFLAVATVFLATLIYLTLIKSHETFVVSALIYSAPVFTLILGMLFLGERTSVLGYFGILSIMVGIGCLAYTEHASEELFVV